MKNSLYFIILVSLFLPLAVRADHFERDLFFGLLRNTDVVRLQEFLRGEGFFTFPESTGNFLSITRDAVARFQLARGITPPAGYFGPITRAKVHEVLSAGEITVITLPAPGEGGANGASAYEGKIVISSFRGTSSKPQDEILVLTNKTKAESINLTGWTIKNIQGHTFEIPRVHNLPGFYSTAQDFLILPPGGKVTVSVGKQERRMDFQENICTGYFTQHSSFKPSISRSCPRLDTETLSRYFNDKCVSALKKISSCVSPSSSLFFGLDSACTQFITDNYSYVGCVKNFRSRPDFFKNQWLVWMQRDEEFFRNTHDTATLHDAFGKIVGERSY